MHPIATHHPNDHRYFWADSAFVEAEDGCYFVGVYHVAVPQGKHAWSIRRNDTSVEERPENGTEVTRAYSREEAEEAVKNADVKYQALLDDDQLELNL